MTGRYEEPERRHNVSWQPSGGAESHGHGVSGQNANPSQSGPYPVDSGAAAQDAGGRHQDPPTIHMEPVSGGPSGPYSVSGGQSGPYSVGGGQPGVGGGQSGPYSVSGAQQPADPYAVSGGPSGPYSVGGGQSGPYSVGGGQSGPYSADPGSGGGYYVDPAPSGPQQQVYGVAYPGGGSQQYPQQPQYAQPQQPQPTPQPGRGGAAQEVTSQRLIKQAKRPPQSGWRRTLYKVSGGMVNLGESPSDLRRRELIMRINQPLRGCYKIAMLSLKGGVGKTTTTTTLGSTFSSLRGDRVIAVDANPDRGTLSMKIPRETTATVRHLLRDAKRITKYSDVRSYTSLGPSRLEVLASEQDPAVSEAFSEEDYRKTIELLEHFYNIVLTDCGTGLMHSAMRGVLDLADSLVIVSSGSVDGAQSAAATLDWLDAHGYRDLVAKSVAVINSVRPTAGKVDLNKLAAHFGARCRAVCRIPFDPHLEEGAEIELDQLAPETRLALLELAATVAADFPS